MPALIALFTLRRGADCVHSSTGGSNKKRPHPDAEPPALSSALPSGRSSSFTMADPFSNILDDGSDMVDVMPPPPHENYTFSAITAAPPALVPPTPPAPVRITATPPVPKPSSSAKPSGGSSKPKGDSGKATGAAAAGPPPDEPWWKQTARHILELVRSKRGCGL